MNKKTTLTPADLEAISMVVIKTIDIRVPQIIDEKVPSIVIKIIEEKMPPIVAKIVDEKINAAVEIIGNMFTELSDHIEGRFKVIEYDINSNKKDIVDLQNRIKMLSLGRG